MRILVWTFLFVSVFSAATQDHEGMSPVPHLDPVRYQGVWNEIASIPARFQRKCVRNTQALYRFDAEKERIDVTNLCLKKNGKVKKARGFARVNPDLELDSQLQVSFVKILGRPIWRFGGDYWVLSLDPNYQVSLVGEPGRDFAWILAREETLSEETLEELRNVLEQNAYDPCDLRMSRTPEQNFGSIRPSLCEYLDN